MNIVDDNTVILLRTIAPYFISSSQNSISCPEEYYSLAKSNGIPLTYLEILPDSLKQKLPVYKYHLLHFRELLRTTSSLCSLLEKEEMNYVVIKTLRPYAEDTADIDLLNLGSNEDYFKIVNIFKREGYRILEKGPYAIGCCSPNNINLDIYNELSANQIIYLDKRKLCRYARIMDFQGGHIRTFTPEADLLVLVAHSAIKEHYNLACFLTTLHYFYNYRENLVKKFVSAAKENNLMTATRWFLTLSFLLCKEAYGTVPDELIDLLHITGGAYHGAYRTCKVRRSSPYTCDSLTLVDVFREKFDEPLFKRSLCNQFLWLINPDAISATRLLSKFLSLL